MEKVAIDQKVVLIGGSAGSIEALMHILPALKPTNKLSVVIVLHRKNSEDRILESLIAQKSALPVNDVEDKTPLLPGHIHIAPSDYHLLFEKEPSLSLDTSEKVNYSRPSIDVAFESAAEAYGRNVAAILLSGANDDGTVGLQAVKERGGVVIIQDPETAEMPYMPQFAIDHMEADFILEPEKIADLINSIGQ